MKKKNGWCYAFWILLLVVLILALAVGLISWAGSGAEDEDGEPATVTNVTISGTFVLAYGDETGSALTANVAMSDGGDYEGDYTWTSSDTDEAVVKVTGSGKTATVTPVSCGTAEITVTVDDNGTDTCTVTVFEDHEAAEKGRITGSAEVGEDFHFMFDDEYDETTTVLFDDSSVSAEYDADTKTYTLSGISGVMGENQASVFSSSEHVGCEYIGFIVNVGKAESIVAKSYSGEGATASEFVLSYGDDTSFLVDLTDHGEDGDWHMELDVTYGGGDEETYTVVLGDIEKGVATANDLQAAINEGEDVALTEDIPLESSLTIGGNDAENVDVTIDLNGFELSFEGNGQNGNGGHTIVVNSGATLTVVGEGTVDATEIYTDALYNEGTVILAGGFFTRSGENAFYEDQNEVDSTFNFDSSYTIDNKGDLTIEDGATVYNAGNYSSCIRNRGTSATLTMEGGKVYGGKYSVANGKEDGGEFVMTGGQLGGLRSDTDALPYRALNNYDNATITGGTLLGGNGGSIDVNGQNKPDECVEGVVIFNEDADTTNSLTIGDGKGNGPEIIYEGINPDGILPEGLDGGDEPLSAHLTYYEEEKTTPAFATGIAAYSGEIDFNAGTISCSDTNTEKEYAFMGVYITDGTLNVSGGKISGDYAIVIDHTAVEGAEIVYAISGGEFEGDIVIYTIDEETGEADSSVFTPDIGAVIIPSEEFTFNGGTFDGFSGLDGDNLTIKNESGEDVEYTAGGITVTEIVGNDGNITFVVDGIVANQMTDEQKVAFDASYENDNGEIRFYIAVKIAVNPGETVTVTGGEKTEATSNTGTEVIYTLWVIEIGHSHFEEVTAETVGDYLVLDISSFTMSVSVTDSEGSEKGGYTIAFGNVFVPLQVWRCASDQHTVSSWTVVEEETCGKEGSKTGVCDYCGEEVTEVIPANGLHAATAYDGTYYAVYCADSEAWCALCETCGQWFEIEKCETCDIYSFVLMTTDEVSLDAAIEVAGKRTGGSETNRTQILVYGTITISDESYVKIDCDNVEIYGLGAESSKIIESAYETDENSGKARDGVEITGSNVTIRDLTIDGTKLNESSTHNGYEHGLEILEGASNVTLSGCVIIGGTSSNSSAVVLMGSNITGYIMIENCTLSGYHGIFIERNDGDELDVTISGGKIDGAYYGILTEGLEGVHTNDVYLEVKNATINGKNSLGAGDSFTFTNCTFGFGVYNGAAYGSINTYCDVTLIDCTFLSNNTSVTSYADDSLVYSSNNYVIQARTADITINLIGCEFVNTYENEDLNTGTLAVTADTFVYLVGGKSSVKNCYLYFDDSDNAVKYAYDSSSHTVTEYVGEEPGDDGNDDGGDDGEDENP